MARYPGDRQAGHRDCPAETRDFAQSGRGSRARAATDGCTPRTTFAHSFRRMCRENPLWGAPRVEGESDAFRADATCNAATSDVAGATEWRSPRSKTRCIRYWRGTVLYLLSLQKFVRLAASEGRQFAYLWTKVEDAAGNIVPAVSYKAPSAAPEGQPSLRDMNVIRAAARPRGSLRRVSGQHRACRTIGRAQTRRPIKSSHPGAANSGPGWGLSPVCWRCYGSCAISTWNNYRRFWRQPITGLSFRCHFSSPSSN